MFLCAMSTGMTGLFDVKKRHSGNDTMKRTTRMVLVLIMAALLLSGTWDNASAAKLKAPTIKSITATQDYIKIKWSGVKKAKTYYVYKKVGGNAFQRVAVLKSGTKTFIDHDIKLGTTYRYKVAVKNSKKLRSSKAKRITPKFVQPCELTTLSNRYDASRKYATISWKNSKSGYDYYVYRKTKGSDYVRIASVKGKNGSQSYTDTKISDQTDYTYTVRAIQKLKKKKNKKPNVSYWADYDKEGITTIAQKVELDEDAANFENLHATVKWEPVDGATHYYIYREKEFSGNFVLLGKVDKDTTQFTDVYAKSIAKTDVTLFSDHFVDPDRNPYHYTVRAVSDNNGKISYGDYYLHGVFTLSQPQIMTAEGSGNNYNIQFCEVYGGQKYEIWSASKSGNKFTWHKLKTVKPKKNSKRATANRIQTVSVQKHANDTYFTVKALSTMKGRPIESTFDREFTIANRGKLKGKKILFYGDSITYGSGYSGKYAYPIRVQQLSGCDYYNPSIPGATYTQETQERKARHPLTERDRLYDQVGVRIRDGQDVIKSFNDTVTTPIQPSWGRTFDCYDVVLFAAGTNDYLDNAEIGDLNSDDPHEFCGAINMTMKFIQEASDKKVEEGKEPIKVVFLDQFYSDRTYYPSWGTKTNRDTTKNDIGLTLTDYQNAENGLIEKYAAGYIFEPAQIDGEGDLDDNGSFDEEGNPVDQGNTDVEGEIAEPDQGVFCSMDLYTMSTRGIINADTCPYLMLDNLHMSRVGSNLVGDIVADFLMNEVY